MSDTRIIKNPSPLVIAILALDDHFSELSRLSARIGETDLKSNFDFDQTERLINRFAECGQAITTDISTFVAVLNQAREQAEAAAESVSARAEQLKARKDEVQEKMNQFLTLSGKVTQLNDSLVSIKKPDRESLSEADRGEIAERLMAVESQLHSLIEEAQNLKVVGQNSKIKVLEQNADSMRQTLIAVSQKLNSIKPLSQQN